MKINQDLLNRASNYVQQILDVELLCEGIWEGGINLPRYIFQAYDFYQAKLSGNQVLLIATKQDTQPLSALMKQSALVERVVKIPVIWIGETIKAYVRKELVAQRLPFIIPFKQAYLPHLGVQFQERALIKKNEIKDKLFAATQVFLINQLLNHSTDKFNPKELSEFMGYSLMTITRIKKELIEHRWLSTEDYKKDGILRLSMEDFALWEATKPYLQSPVRKRLWIRNPTQSIGTLPMAGLSALSEQTLLGKPNCEVRAIGELDWRKLERELDPHQLLPEEINGAVEIEIWRYSPEKIRGRNSQDLNKLNRMVDPYSLYLSLEKNDDDRVQLALTELMKRLFDGRFNRT